jgi:hypothetical protein
VTATEPLTFTGDGHHWWARVPDLDGVPRRSGHARPSGSDRFAALDRPLLVVHAVDDEVVEIAEANASMQPRRNPSDSCPC